MSPTPRPFASQFVESVVLTAAGNVLRVAVGLIALRMVTSAIPEHELGAYWILTSVSALLATFSDLGVGLAAVRHLPLASEAAQRRRLMHTVLAVRVAFLVVVCLLVMAFKPWVLRLFQAEAIAERYHYVYVFLVLTSLLELHTNFLQGLNRFRVIATLAFVSSVGRLILIVVFVSYLDWGIAGLFAAEAAATGLALWISARVSGYGLAFHGRVDVARRQLGFGLPLHVNTLLAYTATRLNMLMVGAFTGPTAVSHFTVASRIPDQVSMMLRSYNAVYLPNMTRLIAEPGRERARRLLTSSLRVVSFIFALGTLALSFFRRELLFVLAPESYQDAAVAIPLLLGGLTFASLGSMMGLTLVASGDTRTPMKINIWTTLFSVVLNLILIPRWGFLGAAWALFAFNVFGYAVTERVLARRLAPESYGYLVVLVALGTAFALGYEAGIAARIVILAASAAVPLVLWSALRADLVRIVSTWRPSRPAHASDTP